MAQVGRRYRLSFDDDHELLPGVVALLRGLSIRQFLDVQRYASVAQKAGKGDQEQIERVLEAVQALGEVTAKALIEWNVEDEDGAPVPTTADGVLSLDPESFMALVEEWLDAVAGVPAPLAQTSSGGQPSEELSMPMEPLSASPSS